MTTSPILFNDQMVRAILTGAKTETRRPLVATRGTITVTANKMDETRSVCVLDADGWRDTRADYKSRKFGGRGDILRVRECFRLFDSQYKVSNADDAWYIQFRADTALYELQYNVDEIGNRRDVVLPNSSSMNAKPRSKLYGRWRPNIHHRLALSRIDLVNFQIRVERLSRITDEDVAREGVAGGRKEFASLWDSIYGEKEGALSWHDDPWIEVVVFEKRHGWPV